MLFFENQIKFLGGYFLISLKSFLKYSIIIKNLKTGNFYRIKKHLCIHYICEGKLKWNIFYMNVSNTAEESSMNINGKKILIVDDDMLNRMVATFILKKHKVIISEAGNGEEAIQHLNNNLCDLVLMDIQMPVLDGYQASEIIRKQLNLTIPIIALTGSDSKEELEKCVNAGMNDYLLKPINEELFIQTISKWINNLQD